MITFGSKLKALRVMLGLSQQQVVDQIPDISQTYLSALENREKAPRQQVLESLNAFYDVDNTYWNDTNLVMYTLDKYEEMIVQLIRYGDYAKAIESLKALKVLDDILNEERTE